jgi:2-isopropylmalate synthase
MPSNTDYIQIFDTTLRDGEQAPGCSMNLEEKLRVAHALQSLKVDVIEAGFAAASPGDFESVSAIASEITSSTVCSLARCNEKDIIKASEAVRHAKKSRIHVFVATSEIHRKYKLQMAKDEIIAKAKEGVSIAKSLCSEIEFSPEDASRTELDFLTDVVLAAIESGATIINIPDTVGYTIPQEFYSVFKHLNDVVKPFKDVILSVHCHNDLGMAVANSLSAVTAGARQVECTINGIGERAGNCALEEVVMALSTRFNHYGISTNIDTKKLYPTSRLVSNITGMYPPRNKAIVGENAFAHEAGIHQHGMLQNSATYEIMKPEDVGLSKSNLVLGKHSGRHAFRQRVDDLGFNLDDNKLDSAFAEFKNIADKKKEITDGDIEAIILSSNHDGTGPWTLLDLEVTTKKGLGAAALVKLHHSDRGDLVVTKNASGPVEAVFQAISELSNTDLKLTKFDIKSVSSGDDAQGEVIITVMHQNKNYRGHGVSTDIVESSCLAYIEVLNILSYKSLFNEEINSTTKIPGNII